MTTYYPPKINTEYIFYVALVDSANRPDFKANPTLAEGDFKASTDGGAFANLTTTPDVDPDAGIAVKITLDTGEMNGANVKVACIDAAGAEWDDLFINIQTAANQLDDVATLVTLVDTVVDAILKDTGTDGVVLKAAGLNADAVDEILDEVIEGSTTLRQAIAVMLAALAGKSSGGGTTAIKFRDVADSKNRISATVDSGGNRTAITIDGS